MKRYAELYRIEDIEVWIKSHTITKLKTHFLRYLANVNKEEDFLFLDAHMLMNASAADFVDFLFENKNCTMVFEDCEFLLRSRSTGNELLNTLLNLSDGIVGDGLHLKFICTFNAMISEIDSAVLRKGRLKYKYEFKELETEKADALAEFLGKDKPGKPTLICEIYNTEDNGAESNDNKIGF